MQTCDICDREFDWTPPDLECHVESNDGTKEVFAFIDTGYRQDTVEIGPATLCRKCMGRVLEEIVRQFNEAGV